MARAAEVLDLAPPSISMQLRQLERRCGVALLERAGRGVTPTAAGRLLYERARSALDILDGIQHDLEELAALENGLLQLASGRNTGYYLVPILLRAFEQRYPRVKVDFHMVASSSKGVELAVLERRSEFGVVTHLTNTASLASETLVEERLLVVCSRRHPFALVRSPTLERLARLDLLLRERPLLAGDYIRDSFEERGLEPRLTELGSTAAIKKRVLAGDGITILPESAIRDELSDGSLTCRDIPDFDPRRSVYLVYRREARLSAAARAFFVVAHGAAETGLLGGALGEQ